MTPESENFDDLRKLLEFKRQEQPPPGYFTNFSSKVIARIEAQEAAAQLTWWRRLFRGTDARPVLVCAYSLTVAGLVGLLVIGFDLASSDDANTAALPVPSTPILTVSAHPVTTTPTTTPISADAATQPQMTSQPRMTLQPMPTQEQPLSVDSDLNPDAAPPGLFSPNGIGGLGRPEQVNQSYLINTR
jgi:hypothetical protein